MGLSPYSSAHWPPRVGQGVDDVGAQAVQAELEHLERADWPRADDDGVNGGGAMQGCGAFKRGGGWCASGAISAAGP